MILGLIGSIIIVFAIMWVVGKALKKESPVKFAAKWTAIIIGGIIVVSAGYTYFSLLA